MNVWIINHYAVKNGHRHFELAKRLVEKGHKCTVIAADRFEKCAELKDKSCSRFCIEEIYSNFNYVWLNPKPSYESSNIKRVINMISFDLLIKKTACKIINELGKPDIVIGSSVHPLAWNAARRVSREYNAKLILEMRDEWPLSLIEIGGISKNHPIIYFFDYINRKALKSANWFIGSSKGMYNYIVDRYDIKNLGNTWIPNGYDTQNIKANATEVPDTLKEVLEGWCVTYTGSIIMSEGIDYLVDVIKRFNEKYSLPITFLIIGEGNIKQHVSKRIFNEGIENIVLHDSVEHSKIYNILKKSKVCVAPARFSGKLAEYGLSMNKLNDYLYSGNPTILTHEGYNVVEDSGAGYCIPLYDIESFVDCIKALYTMTDKERYELGEKGKREIEHNYSYDLLADRLNNIIEILDNKEI